jgi:hypothetical protein
MTPALAELSRARCRDLLLAEANPADAPALERLANLLFDCLHLDYRVQQEQLKQGFEQLRRDPQPGQGGSAQALAGHLGRLLEQGHYRRIETAELQRALQLEAVFRVRLHVRLEDFCCLELYAKGSRESVLQASDWLGLRRRPKTVQYYERVVLFSCLRQAPRREVGVESGLERQVHLKLFENIPAADIEMLLPNTEVGMRPIDHAVIFVPALLGGVGALLKLSASLALLWVLVLFWLGFREKPPDRLDRAAMIACAVGIFAFGSHVWRQIARFRHRKTEFLRTLSENLYFKNLDNDAGVFHRLADEAEEEECKEALLAFVHLRRAARALTEQELDGTIQAWLRQQGARVGSLDTSEGLRQLAELGLVQRIEGRFHALDPQAALALLEERWARYARRSWEPEPSPLEGC